MPSGGKRKGAGRPFGKGPYGEATELVRVPASLVEDIRQFAKTRGFKIPLYSSRVQAGQPEPADDSVEEHVDLARYLVKDPTMTFLVRATGDSMIDAGISEGDMLVVDRGIEPKSMKIVIASIDGQLTIKFLSIRAGKAYLMPANPAHKEIPVNKESGIFIWGVVTNCIKSY